MMKTTIQIAVLGVAFGLLSHATSIVNIELTVTTEDGLPGSALTFSGTLTNETGNVEYLNGLSFADAGFYDSEDPFDTYAPIYLTAYESSGPFELFTVSIPNPFTPGSYPSTVTLNGGAGPSSTDDLGLASYTVQVDPPSTPEPGSAGLLLLGCAPLALLAWRRLRTGASRP
jgi:hypothetical protein